MTTALEYERSQTGPMMRRARELACLRLGEGARAVGISRGELRSIERSRRDARPEVISLAVNAYAGDDLDLPPRRDLIRPGDPDRLVVGDEVVSLDRGRDNNEAVLRGYVDAVRRQRGLAPADPVRFRTHDLVQLASALDLGEDELERRLLEVASLPSELARRAVRTLVLTGLCLAISGGHNDARTPAEVTWLSGDIRATEASTLVSSRIGELDELMAQLRSATE